MSGRSMSTTEVLTKGEMQDETLMKGRLLAIFLVIYVSFILVGGIVFHFIESSTNQINRVDFKNQIAAFLDNKTCVSSDELTAIIQKAIKAYDQGILFTPENDETNSTTWDIPSSIFFSTTIVTTIGYGNIAPATTAGKVFTVFFAFFGIPLFLITSKQLGLRLSRVSQKITSRVERVCGERWRIPVSLALTFLLGYSVFSLAAAALFTSVEGWSYSESLYYTFVTLTTIGFGDYHPEFAGGAKNSGALGAVYRLSVTVWIVLGLVWMASITSFISEIIYGFLLKKSTVRSQDTEGSTEESQPSLLQQ